MLIKEDGNAKREKSGTVTATARGRRGKVMEKGVFFFLFCIGQSSKVSERRKKASIQSWKVENPK